MLGLRGQAKSRILRALTTLLDEQMPYVAGCEIRDNPYLPLCKRCRDLIAERGDATPIAYFGRDDRYVEKLATPDVTVADLVGDIDPIKAARGSQDLSSELTMHSGLLPRANRGIFAINELPDLAAKIQVALFNIMQGRRSDQRVSCAAGARRRIGLQRQSRGLYGARQNRDAAQRPHRFRIRTHYPETLGEGMAITAQEAWSERGSAPVEVPGYIREIVEQVAFSAREDKKVDKRSGVSQRLPISTLDLVVSNAERRALVNHEAVALPRVSDIYAAMPGMTGKLELEYEGEMRGADTVVRDLIRSAAGKIYDRCFSDDDTQQIEEWFNLGGTVKLDDNHPAADALADLKQIQGLIAKLAPLGINKSDPAPKVVSAAEFLLEGFVAHRKLSRSEERVFAGKPAAPRKPERAENRDRVRRVGTRTPHSARGIQLGAPTALIEIGNGGMPHEKLFMRDLSVPNLYECRRRA